MMLLNRVFVGYLLLLSSIVVVKAFLPTLFHPAFIEKPSKIYFSHGWDWSQNVPSYPNNFIPTQPKKTPVPDPVVFPTLRPKNSRPGNYNIPPINVFKPIVNVFNDGNQPFSSSITIPDITTMRAPSDTSFTSATDFSSPPSTSSTVQNAKVLTVQQAMCIRRCVTDKSVNNVCGTDDRTYQNPQTLQCAQKCGKNVQVEYTGTCIPNSS